MLEFARYLSENYKENVTKAEVIIKDKWDKVVAIIKEAFDDNYSDKTTAIHKIKTEFVNKQIAPISIDVDFLNENLDYVIDKVESLEEGEIKIIINNDVHKGSSAKSISTPCTGMCGNDSDDNVEIEMESKKVETEVVEEAKEEIEKKVKITIEGSKVIVEPSEDTGLEKAEHDFDSASAAAKFADSLKSFFGDQGFNIDQAEETPEETEEEAPEEETPEETETEEAPEVEEEGKEIPEPEETTEEVPEETPETEETPEEDEISWEDVAFDDDNEEEEVQETVDIEDADLSKLIGKLVRVEDAWYSVVEIGENNEIKCSDKEGNEVTFTSDQIDEMEYDEEETPEETPETEEVPEETPEEVVPEGDEIPEDEITEEEEEDEESKKKKSSETEETPEEEEEEESKKKKSSETDETPEEEEEEEKEEEMETKNESIYNRMANYYLEEMEDNSANGFTQKPAAPPKKMEKTGPIPPSLKKAPPSASLTAKPSKPKEKLEQSGKVPPSLKKAGPKAALTAKPSKPNGKLEKVKSAEIPKEFK